MGKEKTEFNMTCPLPIDRYPNVLLAHGAGGVLMNDLIEKIFLAAFDAQGDGERHDGAVFSVDRGKLAFSTDSYVVSPIEFPGGTIGTLAVNGTVNDLAMCGAKPLFLSAGMILEEGLPMETLWRVVRSMKEAADAAGVRVVTGDTKVVDRGKGDGIYINTSGVGVVAAGREIAPRRVRPGDAVLLSGDIGRHGMAIMAVREGLEFESPIESDCAPLASLVGSLLGTGADVHCMRDLTRGGLASALVEIADTSDTTIRIDESAVPVPGEVRGACEMLGLDPFYVANEGRMIVFVPAKDAGIALRAMHACRSGAGSVRIGTVCEKESRRVLVKNALGTERVVDMISGEQLPRIC